MKLQYSFDPDDKLVFVADNTGESTKFVIDGMAPADAVRELWVLSCQYDSMPVNTKFACFSDGNPFQPIYDKAFLQMRRVSS